MDITAIEKKLIGWASDQPDIVGIALVGSYARHTATKESDIDVIILTSEVGRYFQNQRWAEQFGNVKLIREEDWGKVRTLRIFYQESIEIEFNFTTVDWAALPPDPGTYKVVTDGMQILLDSAGLLISLARASC
jgi:predicted nucleotidyltransferase